MATYTYVVMISLIASAASLPASRNTKSCCFSYPFTFVNREGWGARPAASATVIKEPVLYVLVHHSYIPSHCDTKDACKQSMRAMQNAHQLTNGWQDIGYNFGVGGEGSVLEGRGWGIVGAHAVGYNDKSVGIVMIGDFVSSLPPAKQLQSLKDLIAVGVQLGYISKNYKLIGHRQVSATECPGQALFNEISTWDHFEPTL